MVFRSRPRDAGDWRWCSDCDRWLLRDEFHGACSKCRSCGKRRSLQRIAPRRDALAALKLERGCADCGYREYAVALDFDHDPPRLGKTLPLSQKVSRTSIPLDELLAEARRCIVLCANCHRVRTAKAGH